ncbi:hypothetical protein ENH_00032360, partial [Eimeria necatrix]
CLWFFIWLVVLTFSVFLVMRNPFEINTSCEQWVAAEGRVRAAKPCVISGWAAAHLRWALFFAFCISLFLSFFISLFIYFFANKRLKRFRNNKRMLRKSHANPAQNQVRGPTALSAALETAEAEAAEAAGAAAAAEAAEAAGNQKITPARGFAMELGAAWVS